MLRTNRKDLVMQSVQAKVHPPIMKRVLFRLETDISPMAN